MNQKSFFILILLSSVCQWSFAKVQGGYDFVVSKNGDGDFTTIQAAINAVPDFRKHPTTIYIKNGVYKEKLVLPASKNMVTFIGQNEDSTIITYDDYASKKNRFGEKMGTTGSSGFYIFGNDFTAKNITFRNTAGPVGQAVTVRIVGDRIFFDHCRFLGFQDTLYPYGEKSRQYYKDCYIEGTVDFIFGWSTAVFDHCLLFCKSPGYVTAASTLQKAPFGFVFLHCNITGSAPAHSVYLGRPWRPYAKVAYIHCKLSSVINPKGWFNWNKKEAEKTVTYVEYKNYGPGAVTAQRVPWSHQLTAKEREKYTLENIFRGWSPGKPFKEKHR